MACSGAGLVAIIILFIAVVLNVISFALPLWTTSNVVNSGLSKDVLKADFATGVWGFCTDVELSNNTAKDASTAFDKCYFFHTSNKYELPTDDEFADKFSDFSICDGYSQADKLGSVARKAYTAGLALVAGMDSTQFDAFIKKSCTALGSATLVFASFAASAGVLAFIGIVLGVTCCKNKSSFNAATKVLIMFALVTNVLTFALWIIQSHPLGKADEVHLSGSFILNVLSALLFLVAGALLGRHNAIKN